jgi:hypothetical protein
MQINTLSVSRKKLWPWLAVAIVLLSAVFLLHNQGRLWQCACGRIDLWVGDIWSSDNSQHISDPYSFTHLLHGIVFFIALAWSAFRLPVLWRFVLAVALESAWEVLENSEFIIQRYREATASLGYTGDSIVNSVGDIFVCAAGFWLAYYLGFRRSLILFIAVEIALTLWIRDSLILSLLMLIYPIEAIKAWQLGLG